MEAKEALNDNVVFYYYMNSEEFANKGQKTIPEICIRNQHTVNCCELQV
jgi:hypothetical protein